MNSMKCSGCGHPLEEVVERQENGFKRFKYQCPCGYAKPGSLEPAVPQTPEQALEEALNSMWPFIDDTNFYD